MREKKKNLNQWVEKIQCDLDSPFLNTFFFVILEKAFNALRKEQVVGKEKFLSTRNLIARRHKLESLRNNAFN